MAVSGAMHPENLLSVCVTKGLHVLGTGDALHPAWQKEWEPFQSNDAGICVVPTGEVEDEHRVHHLILAADFGQFDQIREVFKPYCKSISTNGRPHVNLSGEKIAKCVHEAGAFIGPAHAFTPWTALFAYHDSVAGCYGSEKIDFAELGLSADSSYGAGIPDFAGIPFLSNSDAHSPQPEKIGREFNRIRISGDLSVKNVLGSIRSGAIESNAGFFPEEGKYNRTACVRCFNRYSREDAEEYKWRCPSDGGQIKKGVYDRARELSTGVPVKRPPYIHIVPLGQIIQTVESASSPNTKKCRAVYNEFITAFGNEIKVLLDVPVSDIQKIHPKVADAVSALRENRVVLHPGGGGKYGTFSLV